MRIFRMSSLCCFHRIKQFPLHWSCKGRYLFSENAICIVPRMIWKLSSVCGPKRTGFKCRKGHSLSLSLSHHHSQLFHHLHRCRGMSGTFHQFTSTPPRSLSPPFWGETPKWWLASGLRVVPVRLGSDWLSSNHFNGNS